MSGFHFTDSKHSFGLDAERPNCCGGCCSEPRRGANER